MYEPLYVGLSKQEQDCLHNWLSEREWVSTRNVWILGLRRDSDHYDRSASIQVGFMLKNDCGWVKTGRRANIDGERHWVYVPRGTKLPPKKGVRLHASEAYIDETVIPEWCAGRTHTTTAEILHRLFRVAIPKTMDDITLDAMGLLKEALLKDGWSVKSGSGYREVFHRSLNQFDDILG
ncbi:hypothetical protein [Rhizobium nepotum]|uniref:hypothetical protein n=1 Tax=Rhizobium nepotum TaxID=1035271 RepID=UPI003CE83DC9